MDGVATCAFCGGEAGYVEHLCSTNEEARGCDYFKMKSETASIGKSLKEMVAHIEARLDWNDNEAKRERAHRLRVLCDDLDYAMRDLNEKVEHVKDALREFI
jgi:hypothetical protein